MDWLLAIVAGPLVTTSVDLETATDPFALLIDGAEDCTLEYVDSRPGFLNLLDE